MATKKASKETKLIIRCIKAPLKFLVKVRDFYVEAMLGCSLGLDHGSVVMGCPTAQFSTPPNNFSTTYSLKSRNDHDFRVAQEIIQRQKLQQSGTMGVGVLPKSRNVGMGRIDEEKSCEIEDGDVKVHIVYVYPIKEQKLCCSTES